MKRESSSEEEEAIVGCGGGEGQIWVGHDDQTIHNQNDNDNNLIRDQEDDLLDQVVNDQSSIFYAEFPPLPDFPCMSSTSSSSSSSTPAPVRPMTTCSSSSSSASSWAVIKSDTEDDNNNKPREMTMTPPPPLALSSTASMEFSSENPPDIDCMDMLETFGYMDLLETDEFLDPSLIFGADGDDDRSAGIEEFQQDLIIDNDGDERVQVDQAGIEDGIDEDLLVVDDVEEPGDDDNVEGNGNGNGSPDEMASVFLDWLRTNKETVSAEDLRSVKIKKSTIESAAKRLGGGKEAMKQLLKLILEWVQTNHLHRRGSVPLGTNASSQDPNNSEPNVPNCFAQSTPWPQPQPLPSFDSEAMGVPSQPVYQCPMPGFIGDPFSTGSGFPLPNIEDYNNVFNVESAQPWSPHFPNLTAASAPYSPFPDHHHNNSNNALLPAGGLVGFGSGQYTSYHPPNHQHHQYAYHESSSNGGSGDQRLARLGSLATKEARKKRMARQRRLLSHQRHISHAHSHIHHHHHQSQGVVLMDQHPRMENGLPPGAQVNPGSWPGPVFWSPGAMGAMPSPPLPPPLQMIPPPMVDATPTLLQVDPVIPTQNNDTNNYQSGRVLSVDKRQVTHHINGWKPEKNLRFLLQKVLKQSDVGSLGRIVLPKKEAETHLPELEARDGISIPMEDIGTSRTWNMRYRYWPNNKSRMYLLENTGDFVRANGLQEGDFIVIYSDIKCGKYMIRGVKVRQQGRKSDNNSNNNNKRPVKSHRNHNTSTTTQPGTTNNDNSNNNNSVASSSSSSPHKKHHP